jgi:Mn-dependent DtxR family transcriptional regulator
MRKNITLINEEARHLLGITRDEYALCYYILQEQQGNGWCLNFIKIALDLKIDNYQFWKSFNKLEKLGLVEWSRETYLFRATEKFSETINKESHV